MADIRVVGVDQNQELVVSLNKGVVTLEEPRLKQYLDILTHEERWWEHQSRKPFLATTDLQVAVQDTDITMVIVPTPSNKDGSFSIDYVLAAVRDIGTAISTSLKRHTVVICSTVMPGHTGGVIRSVLEETSGLEIGSDRLGLCYNPEFIALGDVVRGLQSPDFVLIGESFIDSKAGDLLTEVYKLLCPENTLIKRMSYMSAEIAKISLNTFVTMKISFANMLAELCENSPGADVDMVTEAIGTDTRVGSKYLRAGAAFGGPCFPRDGEAFIKFSYSVGLEETSLVDGIGLINEMQPVRLQRFALPGPVAILGLTYKPGTPVTERSAGMALAEYMGRAHSGIVRVFDPHHQDHPPEGMPETGVEFCDGALRCIKGVHTVFIMTPHDEFRGVDFSKVPRVVDVWGMLTPSSNVIHPGKGPMP